MIDGCLLRFDFCPAGTPLASSRSLVGLGKFTVQAKLSGGHMWQHSQIFRQGKYDEDYPFEVNVQFM